MSFKNDMDRIQSGEGSSFNSSLASLERMHREMLEANHYSGFADGTNVSLWLRALRSLERELWPYLDDDDRSELNDVRVVGITNRGDLIDYYTMKLDVYEKKLREFHTAKGFGLIAREAREGSVLEREMR